MSEGDDAERTLPPTQKRLEDARKKGQIPRSQELSAAAVVLAAGGALHFMGRDLGDGFLDLMRNGLSLSREQAMDSSSAIVGSGSTTMASTPSTPSGTPRPVFRRARKLIPDAAASAMA